jgi:hypothetical protein
LIFAAALFSLLQLPPGAVSGTTAPNAAGPRNLDFRDGAEGAVPPGWHLSGRQLGARYSASLTKEGCKGDGRCAVIAGPPKPPQDSFGTLMQTFDAASYRGQTIRLNAELRVEAAKRGDRLQMWVRVDRPNRQLGFFDNMNRRPVRSAEWKNVEIKGRVDDDALTINIGVLIIGAGRGWIDEVSFAAGR